MVAQGDGLVPQTVLGCCLLRGPDHFLAQRGRVARPATKLPVSRASLVAGPLEATGGVHTPPKGSYTVVTGSGKSSFCGAAPIRRPGLFLCLGTQAGWGLVGLEQRRGSALMSGKPEATTLRRSPG